MKGWLEARIQYTVDNMGDTNLHGILRMPPSLWRNDPIDVAQRHDRYLAASDKIKELQQALAGARDLAYKLYWAAWDLKRFARAYAGGYKEADDKEGVAKAEEDFYEACKDLVDVLGMDDE